MIATCMLRYQVYQIDHSKKIAVMIDWQLQKAFSKGKKELDKHSLSCIARKKCT